MVYPRLLPVLCFALLIADRAAAAKLHEPYEVRFDTAGQGFQPARD